MDSFEWNKIIGAILGTLLFVMGIGFIAEAIYAPIEGEGPGYALPGGDDHAGPAEGELVAEGEMPAPDSEPGMDRAAFAGLLAAADAGRGEADARICGACHDLTSAATNRVGPPLWNVVGRQLGSAAGYSYSPAMAEHGAAGETWTLEHLDAFLASPAEAVPGTKMGFGGIADAEGRADLLVYLNTLSDNPAPLPEAGAPPPPPPPAEGAGAMAPPPETAPEGDDVAARVAAADASAGERGARICGACHDLTAAASNRVGPALWGVVDRALGSVPGYSYSPAMAEHGQAGETWTLEHLDAFLTSPAQTVPGTKMGFAGIPDADDRADLLAYLQTLK